MAKKEWEHRVLGEYKASKSVVWRAQVSTAPDGKEFAGIRKFIVKADGTEIVGKDGFSVLYEEAPEAVPKLQELIGLLASGKVKKGTVASIDKDHYWYIKDEEDRYYMKPGKFTANRDNAKLFTNKEEANAVREAQDIESTTRLVKVKVK